MRDATRHNKKYIKANISITETTSFTLSIKDSFLINNQIISLRGVSNPYSIARQ